MNRLQASDKIPDSHLQSPIRIDTRHFLLVQKERIPKHIEGYRKSIPKEVTFHTGSIHSEWIYGYVFKNFFKSQIILKWVKRNVSDMLSGIQQHLEGVLTGLNCSSQDSRAMKYVFNTEDLRLYSQKTIWEDIRRKMQIEKTNAKCLWSESKILPEGINKIYISGIACLIRIRSQWSVLDYDQVMMISDTLSSRFFTVIYHNMLEDHIPGKMSRDQIINLYQVFDNLLLEKGNDSYKTIKCWESIVLSILLHSHDSLTSSSDLYSWNKSEFTREDNQPALTIMGIIESMNLTPSQLSEIHGMYRHWGHPTVDEIAGCKKVKSFAKDRPYPNYQTLRLIKGLMNRQFCISFIRKHGRWPSINITERLKTTHLGKAVLTHSTTLNLYSPLLTLDSWAIIEFNQEFDFDYMPDYTELADDKSLSVKRSEVRTIYNPDMLGYNPGRPTTHRRLLLELLSRKDINIEEYCQKIQWDEIPDDWKIIILHSKEREEKSDPRLFAMAVFEIRAYLCVTEDNLSKTVFEYFPQQTMTLGEADLSKRLYAITRAEDEDFIPIIISIDFKSWNLHWSQMSTDPFFTQLDNLFGTPNLYRSSHKIFQQALVALASHCRPPAFYIDNPDNDNIPEDDPCVWTDHKGGFEGLRQKGWTLITICMLLYVEYQTGMKSIIVGQGDNQVIKLHIPVTEKGMSKECYIIKHKEEILHHVHTYLDCLNKTATDLGLSVKLEETFFSSDTLIYGKDIIYKGAYLPSATKKISRLLTDINEILPTMNDEISTLQSAGLATAQKGHDIIVPYILCQMETVFTISRDIDWSLLSAKQGLNSHIKWFSNLSTKVFLIHLSADFGSCPIQPFLNFLYRGHPDTLTSYTTSLFIGSENCDMCKRLYIYLQDREHDIGEGEAELLILNPNSLNLKKAIPPISVYRKLLQKQLPNITKNRHLSEIFSRKHTEADNEMIEYLIKTQPTFPRFLHEVFRLTEAGTRISFIAKFSNSRTTQLLLSQGREYKRLRNRIGNIESDLIESWRSMYLDVMSIDVDSLNSKVLLKSCPTKVADMLRDYSWYPLLKGEKMVGTTLPHPAHQFSPQFSQSPCPNDAIRSRGYILYKMLEDTSSTLLSTRGPYTPYIGSKTKEKVSGRVMVLPKAYRPLQSAKRAVVLDEWIIHPLSGLHDFIVKLIESRTNIDYNILRFSSGSVSSGSPIHRLYDHVTKRQTLSNFRPNLSTHVYMSTDEMGRYSRGQFNYNIHFQGALHFGLSILQLKSLSSTKFEEKICFLSFKNLDCLEELPNILVSNNNTPPTLNFSPFNPLLYTEVDMSKVTCHPRYQFYTMVDKGQDDQAASCILINKMIHNLNSADWGITESSQSRLSRISVQDIIRININRLIKSLTSYLILLFDMDHRLFIPFILTISKNAWSDLVQTVLLPEVLPELYLICQMTYANLYHSIIHVSGMISRAISVVYNKNKDDLQSFFKIREPIFYVGEHMSLKKVLTMWAKFVYIVSNEQFDIREEIARISRGVSTVSNLPSSDICLQIYNIVHKKYGYSGLVVYFQKYRLKISRSSPESTLRDRDFLISKQGESCINVKSNIFLTFSELSMSCLIVGMSLQNNTIYPIKGLYFPQLVTESPRNFKDHQFHLYGELSTAFMKIHEIMISFGISVEGEAVCLGDGEGGISSYLIRMGCDIVYFNTLIDTSSLLPHRGTSFTPASCILERERIKLGELSAILGGDLLDQHFINTFTEELPVGVNLLVNDAEPKGLDFKRTIQFHKNILSIVNKTKPKVCISKIYLTHDVLVSDIISMYLVFYDVVKIVTPFHSSNESLEVYLFCNEFRVSIYNFLNTDTIGRGSPAYIRDVVAELRKCRLADEPLQDIYKVPIDHYTKVAKILNIPSTLPRAVEKMWGFTNIFILEKDWIDQFSHQVKLSYDLLKQEAVSSGMSQSGMKVTMLGSAILSHGISLHTVIEKMMLNHLNAQLLLDIANNPPTHAHEILRGFLNSDHEIIINNQPYYTMAINSQSWKKNYQRSFWVICGHLRFEDFV